MEIFSPKWVCGWVFVGWITFLLGSDCFLSTRG